MRDDSAKKVRMSVDLTGQLNEVVEQLASKMGISKSEVLKRGIALLDASVEQQELGRKVGATSDRSRLETEFIGFS